MKLPFAVLVLVAVPALACTAETIAGGLVDSGAEGNDAASPDGADGASDASPDARDSGPDVSVDPPITPSHPDDPSSFLVVFHLANDSPTTKYVSVDSADDTRRCDGYTITRKGTVLEARQTVDRELGFIGGCEGPWGEKPRWIVEWVQPIVPGATYDLFWDGRTRVVYERTLPCGVGPPTWTTEYSYLSPAPPGEYNATFTLVDGNDGGSCAPPASPSGAYPCTDAGGTPGSFGPVAPTCPLAAAAGSVTVPFTVPARTDGGADAGAVPTVEIAVHIH